MSIQKILFGNLADGRAVHKYTLNGKGGLCVSVLDYGATLQSIVFEGKDVILGYNTLEEYVKNGGYLGATVGRYANRIAQGRFQLNGIDYQVTQNQSNGNHLHGGNVGFDQKVWDMEIVANADIPTLRATTTAADGEEGFPGNMVISVTFTVEDDNALRIAYHAETDKDTVASFTNHAYFNLNGDDGDDVKDTLLTVYADYYTATDSKSIPIGITEVNGTPLDFRVPKTIGECICSTYPAIAACKGLDHNFVIAMEQGTLRPAAYAVSPHTNIALTCLTDMPGLQIYTANGTGARDGKNGPIAPYHGFCLETQFFPDTPNHPAFPSCVVKAGEAFDSATVYAFKKL